MELWKTVAWETRNRQGIRHAKCYFNKPTRETLKSFLSIFRITDKWMRQSRSGRSFVESVCKSEPRGDSSWWWYEGDMWQAWQLNGWASRILVATRTLRLGCRTCFNMWTCIVLHWSLRREGVRKCCLRWCYQLPHWFWLKVGGIRNLDKPR